MIGWLRPMGGSYLLCFSCQLMVMRRNDWWWSQLLDIEIWKWWWNSSQTNTVWTLFQEQTDPNKEGSSGTLLSSLGKKVKPRNSHCLKSVGRVCLLVCWIKILLLLHCLHSLEVLEACLPRKRVHDMLHWVSQSAKHLKMKMNLKIVACKACYVWTGKCKRNIITFGKLVIFICAIVNLILSTNPSCLDKPTSSKYFGKVVHLYFLFE